MRLYDDLADWWPLLSPPSDYEDEAAFYERQLDRAASRPLRTLLELGSGGGNNASFLKRRYAMTLVDRSPGMLAVSRALNPECEHVQGDMRSVRLNRMYDAVFVHDSICYMTREQDLAEVFATAYAHCAPGGVALFAPDYVRETFTPPMTDHGGEDGADRSLRYLEWVSDPDPTDTSYVVDYAYLLRQHDGLVRLEHDQHIEGIFAMATWLRLLHEAGFQAAVVQADHSGLDPCSYQVFVGRKE
jgi:SAM-dependent methyltransferase